MEVILILNAGNEAVPGIKKAKKMGLKVVLADKNKFAPGFKYSDYQIYESIYNYQKLLRQVIKLNNNIIKINGVIAMGSDTPIAVAKIAKQLHLPGNSIKTSLLSTNKLLMKEKLQQGNINIPWYSEIRNLAHLKKIIKEKKGKFILKPVDSRGSRGVLQIDKNSKLHWCYEHSLKNSPKKKVMIERFLPGKQISTESIIHGKDSVTPGMIERNYEYLKKFKPYVIENGGQQPVNLSKEQIRKISEITVDAGRCLGVKYGTVKGDIVLYRNKAYVIEIATRLSGGWMSSDQIPLGTGIDFLKLAINIALGKKLNFKSIKIKKKKNVVIRYFFPKFGIIYKLNNKIKKNKYIKKFMIMNKNYLERNITNHTQRLGFVIAVAKNKSKAILEAKKFMKEVLVN